MNVFLRLDYYIIVHDLVVLTYPLLLSSLLSLQEENDPSKILSLFIMGEYEELNDLVRDGSKKLRDYKSQPDEVLVQMNRPRSFNYNQNQSSLNSRLNFPTSPTNSHASSPTSFSSRKRGFSKERIRQKFNVLPKSAHQRLDLTHVMVHPSVKLEAEDQSTVAILPTHLPPNTTHLLGGHHTKVIQEEWM